MTLALNILLFQAGWFACVLGAAHGLPWLGALAAAAIVAWHLARAAQARPELALVALAVLFGALFETLLVQTGWVHFDTGILVEGVAPYWMVALWAIFATTLKVSLRSLRPYRWLAALLGAIGGPAAYFAGAQLGALEFGAAGTALAAIGIGWAILTPAPLGAATRRLRAAMTTIILWLIALPVMVGLALLVWGLATARERELDFQGSRDALSTR